MSSRLGFTYDLLKQEHKCVLDSCRKLQEEGFDITYLGVQQNGILDLQELEAAIRPDTSLVSVMSVNNETGVIQPIKEIGAIVRKHRGVHFHTDAAQAVGKIPLDVNEMNIDLMSISGHKIYGPKGIGAAYVRRRPRVRLEPILSGGGQERGLRSGTLPAALAVGIGEAARIAKIEMVVSVFLVLYGYDEICAPSQRERRELSRDTGGPWVASGVDVSEDPLCRGTEPSTSLALYRIDAHPFPRSGTMPKSKDWHSASSMDLGPGLTMSSGTATLTVIPDASTSVSPMSRAKVFSWP